LRVIDLKAMSPEALNRLAPSVQPLVFETGILDAPYSTAGTTFLVGYKRRAFVFAARHSLRPDALYPLCVFPSDTSQRLLPLKDVFFVPREHVEEDFADFAVIEIDLTKIVDFELGQARLIDLQFVSGDWLSCRDTSDFVVLGFPEEHSVADYDQETLTTERVALRGRYFGPSALSYLHELEVLDTLSLATFSGFSGAPVFAWTERPGLPAQTALCGMALRGTPSSRRIHFLDRSVLLDALNVKCAKP
jgi:hypothetical protein